MKNTGTIQDYHQRTKHHPDRYARSAGYMDWQNQPNPFRFYADAERLELPLWEVPQAVSYGALFDSPVVESRPVELSSVAALLELGLGLSAWKRYGTSEWSLRMNPSSGNLHPTEAYLLLPETADLPACIAHYSPLLHCLEIRYRFDSETAGFIKESGGFGLILSSIFWREAWKYGERAFRYTQHDIGHALGALRFSATLQGWKLGIVPEINSELLDRLLGFSDAQQVPGEAERADCLCWISAQEQAASDLVSWLSNLPPPDYRDTPNPLSPAVVDWPVIDEAAKLCTSPGYPRDRPAASPASGGKSSLHDATTIIRQRRSAQAYDAAGSRMDYASFRGILQATLPTGGAPFDLLSMPSAVHLFVFVHRVDGLEPGLYCLLRNDQDLAGLRESCSADFLWQRVEPELPLYLLQPGDYRTMAESISCHQAIAGDSSFSLGMLARFDELLEEAPWVYPALFWEAGLIGQVLYLEAEEKGFRGTGIGCYFDDVMHELLGIQNTRWQDLYHFTIGAPVADQRVQTKPPYHHLEQLRGRSND